MIAQLDKDRPSPEWAAAVRLRYPCDREIDRVLNRKMAFRAGPGYSPVSLERLTDGVNELLRGALQSPYRVLDARWLSGGASKLQMAFELDWDRPSYGRSLTRMVLRMEPAESIVETSRLQEFQLVQAAGKIVPTPPCFWVDSQAAFFPYPALIYGFVDGVTKPTGKASNVSGFGIAFPPEVRRALAPQFVKQLAAIHTWDWAAAGMSSFDVPTSGEEAIVRLINKWARIWEEDSNEDIPLMRYAESWLRANIPMLPRAAMLHGDYRAGNFLFSELGNQITAWLDWELGHPGDPHEEIALLTLGALGTIAEDGKTFLVSGLIAEEEFYDAYEAASGIEVNRKSIGFYRAFSAWRSVISLVATGYRVAHNHKTHQDIVVSWIMALGYSLLADLHAILEAEG